jgi:hypothetical protein
MDKRIRAQEVKRGGTAQEVLEMFSVKVSWIW